MVYARPFAADGKQPLVAVVVTGLGLSKEATEAAISKMPPEVSLSFSPYAGNLDNWIRRARNNGHEVLLDLPLEPPNFPVHDAGPLAVMTSNSPVEAIEHLDGSWPRRPAMSASPQPCARRWRPRNWAPMLHDCETVACCSSAMVWSAFPTPTSRPPSRSPWWPTRRRSGRPSTPACAAAADGATDGSALAYVSARPVTFERLLAWFATFPQKGVVLAPASAVVRPPH